MSASGREFDDDYRPRGTAPEERPTSPRKGRFPVWLVVLLVGGAVFVFGCGGLGTVAYVTYRRDMARQEMTAERDMVMAERERMALRDDRSTGSPRFEEGQVRELWRFQVADKTPDEVTASVGQPDSTEERNGDTRWVYEGRTQKPDGTGFDKRAVVTFRNGRVAEVAFE